MTLIVLSGGMDSTLCCALEPAGGCRALGIDYGAPRLNARELSAAAAVAAHYGIPFEALSLPFPPGWNGSLMDADSEHLQGEPTVVPGRNAVLFAFAAGYAQAHGLRRLVVGCNATDRETYPDCRVEFLLALSLAFRMAYGVSLDAPLIELTKAEIVVRGNALGVPWDLTWSCYRGGPEPCGVCGACWERQQGFLNAQLAAERPARLARGGS